MENNVPTKWKHGFNYGVIISAVVIFFSLLIYVADLSSNEVLRYFSYLIILVGLFFTSKIYRDKYLGGFITFQNSFSVAFIAGLVSSVFLAIFAYVFFAFIGPEQIDEMMKIAEEKMIESNPEMTDEQIDMALNVSRKMMTPVWMTIWALLGNAFFSAIFALIISIFVKKEDKLGGGTLNQI